MALAGIAINFVKKAALEGLGANATLKILREMGLGYRRQDFLRDYRMFAQLPKKANVIKYVNRKYRLTKSLFVEPKGFMSRRFAFVSKIKVYNPQKKTTFILHNRVASMKNLTRGQAEQASLNAVSRSLASSNLEIKDITLAEAYHQPGEPWL